MKFVRFLGVLWFVVPCVSFAASSSEFQNASQLLSAARRGDTQTVQILINRGADVNFVDSTGLSLVCTAVMNNDSRAIQVLQMYGADASQCDRQIKNYKQKSKVAARGEEYGFFSGLSSSHILALSAVGVAAVIGGVALLTDAFDAKNDNGASSSGGSHSGSGGGSSGGTGTPTNTLFVQNLPYGPACSGSTCPTDFSTWQDSADFTYMSDTSTQNTFNYLMVARAYNAFVRGYLGMKTVRNDTTKDVFDLSAYPFNETPSGGKPINVATITASGVNATGSAVDGIIDWFDDSAKNTLASLCPAGSAPSAACQAAVNASVKSSHKYYNLTGTLGETPVETTSFDLVDGTTVFGSATDEDTKLAKIIAGWEEGGRTTGDFYGFIPNGQLTVYKVGTGSSGVSDYKNYAAILNALTLTDSSLNYVTNVVANLSLPSESFSLSYATVSDANILYNAANTEPLKIGTFTGLVNNYYNLNTGDDTSVNTPAQDMTCAFYGCSQMTGGTAAILKNPVIVVNSAGRTQYGLGDGKSLSPQVATFENYAPVVYNNLQNLFMTVVAVKPNSTTGTAGLTVDEYNTSGAGKLELSTWQDTNDSNITYSSRMCGLSGTGNGGAMNPWCFVAPGTTDLEAAASMAGAVALVKSAFDYMTSNQIFLLLALTADGPYLGTNPNSSNGYSKWTDTADLITYLRGLYNLPGNLDSSDSQYLESFKNAFGYGMINLERATRPTTNVYFYSSNTNSIVSSSGNAFWGKVSTTTSSSGRASTVLGGNGIIRTSFYDVLESADGSISLPRVWNNEFSLGGDSNHGLYMGDVLADFSVDSTNKHTNKIGNMTFDMAMSPRAYVDNLNGLDALNVKFSNENYDLDAGYQHYLTDGESRFSGRANGLLSLVSNSVSSGAKYKTGNFSFGASAFSGTMSDENLLENDPVVSSQFEPACLGFANGGSVDISYNNRKFGLDVSFGNMNETNTVLGAVSEGLLALNGAKTQYVDAVANYKPFEKVNLSARATFADTVANVGEGIISELSNIKSNAFALGLDAYGFSFSAAMPLAVVNGKMGYDYADLSVVENDGTYKVAVNNPRVEYIDLAAQKRELRFSGAYRKSVGDFTDAGIGFIYRVNPANTDVFGNESIMMFKIHHRLGI